MTNKPYVDEARFEIIQEFLTQLSLGNFEHKISPSSEKDDLDTIIIGMDMVREEIKHSQSRYSNLFNHSSDAIFIVNGETSRIIDVNEKATKMLGYSRNEFLNMNLLELTPDDPSFDKMEAFRALLNEKESLIETAIITKSGKTLSVEIASQIISIDNRVYIQGFFRDITERKKHETRQNAIFEIAKELHKELSILEFLESVASILKSIYSYESFYVFTFNKEENVITRIFESLNGEDFLNAPFSRKGGNGLSEHVIKTGNPLYLRGTEVKSFQEERGMTIYGKLAKTWISFPIQDQNECIGNIILQSTKEEIIFSDEDQKMLNIISSQIGAFINRRNSEKKIIESESKYRHLLNDAPDATIIAGEDGIISVVNKKASEVFGYTQKEFIGMHVSSLFSENSESKIDFKAVGKKNRKFISEEKASAINRSGNEFPTELSISNIEIEQGKISIYSVRDISERVKAEEEIRTYERYFSVSLDLLCIASLEGMFLRINPQFEEVLGYSTEELLNTNFLELIHPEDLDATLHEMEKIGQGINTLEFVNRYRTKKGEYVWFMWSASLDIESNLIYAAARDITQIKELELELKENQEKLQSFFNIAPIGIARNDMNGKFIEVNREFNRFTGYTVEELNQLSNWDLTPESYKDKEAEQLDSLAKYGNYGPYEKEYIHKDGTRYPVLLNGVIVKDKNGEDFIWSVVQDITKLKQTKETLRKVADIQHEFISSQNSDIIFHSMLDGLLKITGCEYGFISEVSEVEDEQCMQVKAINNVNWSSADRLKFSNYDRPNWGCENMGYILRETLKSKRNSPLILNALEHEEFPLKPPYGLDKFKNFMGLPIYSNKKLIGVIGVANRTKGFDNLLATELKSFIATCSTMITAHYNYQVQKRIENENKKLADIVSITNDAIISTDTEGVITGWNSGAERLFGYKTEETLNKSQSRMLLPKEMYEMYENLMKKTLSGAPNEDMELKLIKKNGDYVAVSMSCFPIMNSDKTIVGISSVIRDITERQAIELERMRFTLDLEKKVKERTKELVDMQKELQISLDKEKELGILKSRFVSTASHQFRTPLTIIQSNSELLDMIAASTSQKIQEKMIRPTSRIKREIKRMTSLMDDILILEKLTSGQQHPEPTDIDVIEFLDTIIMQFNNIQKDGRKVEFIHNKETINCCLDPKLLDHAVTNLVGNAIKYSQGAANPELKVCTETGNLVIEIKDYGIGIPEEDLKNLFTRFFRGSNAGDVQGTGLGLNIAKEYVQLNGGTLEITSKENEGTLCVITLPIDSCQD